MATIRLHRTARAAQARADALEITAGARAAADDIRARAQRDAARAARIASLAVSDATLTRRLLIETFTRVLDAADVHPVYVGAGDRVFEIPVLYDARGAGGSP